MGLSDIFATKGSAFRAALRSNDLEAMRQLLEKKGFDGYRFFEEENYPLMSRGMMRLFATELDARPGDRWWPNSFVGSGRTVEEKRQYILGEMAGNCAKACRIDLLDELLNAKIDFNRGAAGYHLIDHVIDAKLPEAGKAGLLRRMLAGGYGRIENPELFLQRAARENFIAGVDLLAAAGFNIHATNELLLRNAAKAGQAELCRHLVAVHKADAALAVKTADELGNGAEAACLRGFMPVAPAEAEKPATVESLAAEVRELKAALRDLTALVQDMRMPEKNLDKPSLAQPKR